MKNFIFKRKSSVRILVFLAVILYSSVALLFAKDTDIYQVNTKQNCYILLDNSGSMDFGVYEQSIDYGAMFDYLFRFIFMTPLITAIIFIKTTRKEKKFFSGKDESELPWQR